MKDCGRMGRVACTEDAGGTYCNAEVVGGGLWGGGKMLVDRSGPSYHIWCQWLEYVVRNVNI